MSLRILNLEPENYSRAARAILDSFAQVDECPLSYHELKQRVPDYDVLIVRLGYRIDRDLLALASRLKAVVTATTGLDHVDLDAARERNVEVLSLEGERDFLDTVSATAEHTWGLLLALVRHIPAAFVSVLEGQWERNRFVGSELRGRTMGVVGYGRLGMMVARFAQAFGMGVLGYDHSPWRADETVERVDLPVLLREADAISLHVPLSDETRRMIGPKELSMMRRGVWLINTSRGEVVDEQALIRALESGHLGGAGLDVLAGEMASCGHWLQGHPLVDYARTHNNLLLTPHIGGATRESMEKTEIFMARKLRLKAKQW